MADSRIVTILDVARHQVLERGDGLDAGPGARRAARCPTTRSTPLLELAHEVRMRWCGPEVEVEGIVSLKTGGCPEDCHFCSQSGLFDSPVRSAWLDIPTLVEAAKQTAETGATEFCIVAAVRGPDARLMAQVRGRDRGDPGRGRHQRRLLARHAHPRAGRRARRDGRAPLQPQPRDRALVLPARRHHAHLGGALGDAADGPRRGHGGVLRRHRRDGRDRRSSGPSSPPSSPSSSRTRCR